VGLVGLVGPVPDSTAAAGEGGGGGGDNLNDLCGHQSGF